MIYYEKEEGCVDKFEEVMNCALEITANTEVKLSVNLQFLTKEEIAEVNKQYRNIDKATDVLSFPLLSLTAGEVVTKEKFPFDYDPDSECICLGDILICKDIAQEQAEMFGHSKERELYYLFIHGMLHLLGYDHEQEQDKYTMREKEEEVLKRFDLHK